MLYSTRNLCHATWYKPSPEVAPSFQLAIAQVANVNLP